MGNRLGKQDSAAGTTSYDYDNANRLMLATGAGGDRYASDADGNTTTSGRRTNVWDSQNRLVSCTSGGVTSTYTYGADGLRRSATVNGRTTYYVYDGQMLVREMQQNAQRQLQATVTYMSGLRGPECRIDETQQSEGYFLPGYTDANWNWVNPNPRDPATGQYLPPKARGKTSWYVYDGLGSVVGEVDPSGNMTSTGTFDVYGAKRAGGTGTATSRQGFVGSLGHVTDSETGLVYMRARYYDPNVGRFVSEDPGRHGTNWFVYASNNPNNRVDITGKEDLGSLMAGMAGSAGLDGLGLSALEGTAGVTEDGAYAFIEYIESTGGAGSGTFNKDMFIDFMEQFAKQEGQDRVGIAGQTVEGGPGEAMFKNIADILGNKVDSFSQENGVSELYWLLQ